MHALTAAADLVAVTVLVAALYQPRHRRRDLVVAYVAVNVGVLAVSSALGGASIGAGLGLGLFGVLSIIRLRSTELSQHEVAYYFSALALGLLGGMPLDPPWLGLALMALVVGTVAVVDHPRVLRRQRRAELVLDTAFTDEDALAAHVEALLGGRVHTVSVQRIDLVDNTTAVEVRYERPAPPRAPRRTRPAHVDAPAPVPVGP